MEYYTATKRSEFESFAVIVMSLELVIQSEVYINIEFRCSSWIQKRHRNQRSNCQHQSDHRISKRIPGGGKKNSTSASLTMLTLLTVQITINWKILKEIGNLSPEKAACWSRNNNQNWAWKTYCFKIGKDCILSPCLFNFQVEYIT